MRMISGLLFSAMILVWATAPVGAASSRTSVHGSPHVGVHPSTGAGVVSGRQHGVTPLKRKLKMGPGGCYNNCRAGGMQRNFCRHSCY